MGRRKPPMVRPLDFRPGKFRPAQSSMEKPNPMGALGLGHKKLGLDHTEWPRPSTNGRDRATSADVCDRSATVAFLSHKTALLAGARPFNSRVRAAMVMPMVSHGNGRVRAGNGAVRATSRAATIKAQALPLNGRVRAINTDLAISAQKKTRSDESLRVLRCYARRARISRVVSLSQSVNTVSFSALRARFNTLNVTSASSDDDDWVFAVLIATCF